MTTYIVTFEIEQEAWREALKKALRANYTTLCPIHGNAWAIATDKKAVEVRDGLRKFLQAGDRLFVIRSGTEAAWFSSYGPKNDEWLKERL